ncbi:MAG TPA: hypothetical protein GX507_03050 [Clostridia bacterium]|nr:hypothetical protein [Clostridia bacterium]
MAVLVTRILVPVFARLFPEGGLVRSNYRGVVLPYGAGLAFVFAWAFALPFMLAFGLVEPRRAGIYGMTLFGVCLVGLLDDMVGTGQAKGIKGIKGHFSKALEGYISTGALKALFIVLISFIAAFGESEGLIDLWRNAAIVSLTTNAFNALDVRPGRALKAYWASSLFALTCLGLLTEWNVTDEGVMLTLPVLASTAAYGLYDLKERLMMGDAGANTIGASLGLLLILAPSPGLRTLILATLFLFQILIEVSSVSHLVERSRMLRWVDALGGIQGAGQNRRRQNASKRNLYGERE